MATTNTLAAPEARLSGEGKQLVAAIAQTKGKIAETELQIIQASSRNRNAWLERSGR